jgi:hypothetical protein
VAALSLLAELPFVYMLVAILQDSLARPEHTKLGEDLAFSAGLFAAGPLLVALSSLNVARAAAPRWALGVHLMPLMVAGALNFFTAGLSALGGGGALGMALLLGTLLGAVSAVLSLVALLLR